MHAYLVSGRDQGKVEEEIGSVVKKLKAKRLDFVVTKIDDVRQLGHFTNLSMDQKTAVVVKNMEESSDEAQNAFLKALEEPQKNLVYILSVKDVDLLLPTIVSRCQVVEITGSDKQLPKQGAKETQRFLEASIGERLGIVSKISKREEAVEFLTNLIINTQPMLIKNPKLAYTIEGASQTLEAINANGNASLQLTNFVVSLDNDF